MPPDHGSVPASVWSNPNPGIVPATEYHDDACDDYHAQDNRPEGDQDNNGGDYSDHLQDVHVQPVCSVVMSEDVRK